MKSVQELYDSYTFEEAEKNLETIIENSLKSKDSGVFRGASTEVTIPNPIMEVFLKYPEQTKSFIKKMESLGYSFKIGPERIRIVFRLHKGELALEKAQVDFFEKNLQKEEGSPTFRQLLDSDIANELKKSFKQDKNWAFSFDRYSKEQIVCKKSKITVEIKKNSGLIILRQDYEGKAHHLSAEDSFSLFNFVLDNFDLDDNFLNSLKDSLK